MYHWCWCQWIRAYKLSRAIRRKNTIQNQRGKNKLLGDRRLRSRQARQTLQRLLKDLQLAAGASSQNWSLGPVHKLDTQIAAVSKDLARLREADLAAAEAGLAATVAQANGGSAADWLSRRGGHRSQVTFNALVAALMAQEPGATEALRHVNPALEVPDIAALLRDVAQVLCLTVRIGQIARVQWALEQLRSERVSGAGDLAVRLRAQAAAAQLAASRHYFAASEGGSQGTSLMSWAARGGGGKEGPLRYDPRMLVFEFLFNILLRESQVKLLEVFMDRAAGGRSVCHQMIMGEGKTTVIAPLLALLMADGRRLVCACMPSALLDMSRSSEGGMLRLETLIDLKFINSSFSNLLSKFDKTVLYRAIRADGISVNSTLPSPPRSVMSERFSSPVLPRPVLTLSFHRRL